MFAPAFFQIARFLFASPFDAVPSHKMPRPNNNDHVVLEQTLRKDSGLGKKSHWRSFGSQWDPIE